MLEPRGQPDFQPEALGAEGGCEREREDFDHHRPMKRNVDGAPAGFRQWVLERGGVEGTSATWAGHDPEHSKLFRAV